MLALIRVEVCFVVCCVGVKNCCESLCDTCVDLSVTVTVNQRVFAVVKLCSFLCFFFEVGWCWFNRTLESQECAQKKKYARWPEQIWYQISVMVNSCPRVPIMVPSVYV